MKSTVASDAQASHHTFSAIKEHHNIPLEASRLWPTGFETAFREKLARCIFGKPLPIDRITQNESEPNEARGNEGGRRRQMKLMQNTLRRRQREHYNSFERQVHGGRPGPHYRKCFNSNCTRCMWGDIPAMVTYRDLSSRDISVEDYTAEFLEALVRRLFGENLKNKGPKYRAIESFFVSPPIIMLFSVWINQAVERRFDHLNCLQISYLLASLQDTTRSLVELAFISQGMEKWHGYFIDESYQGRAGDWKPVDHVIEFLACAESWRRYQVSEGFRPEWKFGSVATIAEILSAIFLQLHVMYKEECFSVGLPCPLKMDSIWETWLSAYPPRAHAGMPSSSTEVPEGGVSSKAQCSGCCLFKGLDVRSPSEVNIGTSDTTGSNAGEYLDENHGWPHTTQSSEEVFEGIGMARTPWIYNSLSG